MTIKQFGWLSGSRKSENTALPSNRAAGHRTVSRDDVIGSRLALQTVNDIQIFFIGVGKDPDLQIGGLLAEATGAEFIGVTEEDLANVLEEFSKYF